MKNAQPSSPPADPARPDPSEARPANGACGGGAREPDPTDENLRALRRATNLSLAMMEQAVERSMAAQAEPDGAAADRSDLAFERSSRALRLSIFLSDRIHADRLVRERKLADTADGEARQRKARLKGQVERLVKDAIQHAAAPERPERLTESEGETEAYDEVEFDEVDAEDRRDALCDVLADRLRDEDVEQDLGNLPTSEMVGRLCDELGIKTPWARWDTQHWAKEEARRKVPGSPYAEPRAAAEPEAVEAPAAKPELAAAGPAPEPPAPPAAEAKPEEPAAAPRRDVDWYRTPEAQREHEAYLARVRARYPPPGAR